MKADTSIDLAGVARRALPLLDLTSLNEDDTPAGIAALCRRAVTTHGPVAAVCIYARFVARARELLDGTGVRVATVVNFPRGDAREDEIVAEIEAALAAGAEEIDLVAPFAAYFEQKGQYVDYLRAGLPSPQMAVRAARRACADKTLKVILETGLLGERIDVFKAATTAIKMGADFIKTSTGKVAVGATPEAAEAMLRAIQQTRHHGGDRHAGFKVAGGVRTVRQAAVYLDIADRLLGTDYPAPARFRFGASGLLDDLLAVLGEQRRGGHPGKDGY